MQPVFSVIIPVYNRAHQIGECLTSVLSQSKCDFEVIIVDNNSTDDLVGALNFFQDARIRLVKCSIPGPGAARNFGVRVARGRYLSFIDSDDLWRRDVLETALPHMEKGAAVVYLTIVKFPDGQAPDWRGSTGDPKSVCELRDIGESITIEAFGTGTMCAVRSEIVSGPHRFDEEMRVGEDLDWALRHVASGPAVVLQDAPRLACRVHEFHSCRDQTAYQTGTLKLIEKARNGVYELAQRQPVRRMIVRLLMASLVNIARYWGGVAALKIYPKVVRLAFAWREFRLVLFPEHVPLLFRVWVKKQRRWFSGS